MSASKCIKPHATNRSESTLRGIVLVMALAALLFPGATWADTVVLDDGAVTLRYGGFHPAVIGTTIEATGPGTTINLVTGLGALGGSCGLCFPGTTVDPSGDNSTTVAGTVTYLGVMYHVGAGPDELVISGESFILPGLADHFSASVPFHMGLRTDLCSVAFQCFGGLFDIRLVSQGQGIATFTFVPDPEFPDRWAPESGIYEIQPIPEPGTWLLVPTAIGLAWLVRKKRKAA
jgi:hypothetical protein